MASMSSRGIVESSYGTNGYVKFSDGLILQWGLVASTPSVGTTTTNFPLTFPNQCTNVQVHNTGTKIPWDVSPVNTLTTTSFNWQNNASNAQTAIYFATGF